MEKKLEVKCFRYPGLDLAATKRGGSGGWKSFPPDLLFQKKEQRGRPSEDFPSEAQVICS